MRKRGDKHVTGRCNREGEEETMIWKMIDPKVFNPPLVGWIQTPIQIRFRGGQTQVRWIQGRVDSENITRYSQK